jgi:hypothetical protein
MLAALGDLGSLELSDVLDREREEKDSNNDEAPPKNDEERLSPKLSSSLPSLPRILADASFAASSAFSCASATVESETILSSFLLGNRDSSLLASAHISSISERN